MKYLNLTQGTPEWIEARQHYFTASEAAAMMGVSKYQKREDLLLEKATGQRKPVSSFMEMKFQQGHDAEAGARPLAEKLIGEEVSPVVAVEGKLLASFDGITIGDDILFEHKLWNEKLAETVLADQETGTGLEAHYYYQLEHQLFVSGADRVLFVCSDGTEKNFVHCWYCSIPERREQLLEGWEVFGKELEAFKAGIESGEIKAPVIEAVERTDDDFLKVEQEYQVALAESEAAKARLDEAKANLVKKADGVKSKGALFQVFKKTNKGSVKWAQAFKKHCPDIPESELSEFRGPPSDSWQVQRLTK